MKSGSSAGNFIEDYCIGLIDYWGALALTPRLLSYKKVGELAEDLHKQFPRIYQKHLKNLKKRASKAEDDPERLLFLLQQTAKYELTLLSIDYEFNKNLRKEFVPLFQVFPLDLMSLQLQLLQAII